MAQEADSTKTVGNTEPVDTADGRKDNSLPFETDVPTTLLDGMDPEILGVLKEHLKLIVMLLPTLHVTVREPSSLFLILKFSANRETASSAVGQKRFFVVITVAVWYN